MRLGEIVLLPLPLSDAINVKIRPAIVVCCTADKYRDVILVAVSSVGPKVISKNEFLITPTKINNLRIISVAKIDRIVTLKAENIIATLGNLSPKPVLEFKAVFKSLID
jgi:mRNA-degrading endonuclease toxin of MazEF toxin-antitoxin module